MKIKRMANGYNLRCNDSEFEALSVLVALAEGAGKLTGNANANVLEGGLGDWD